MSSPHVAEPEIDMPVLVRCTEEFERNVCDFELAD
jgi:hypothetical protein